MSHSGTYGEVWVDGGGVCLRKFTLGGVSGLNWGGELFIFRGEISCGDVL